MKKPIPHFTMFVPGNPARLAQDSFGRSNEARPINWQPDES